MQPTVGDCVGLTWFTGTGPLVSKASSLRAILSNLASFVMDVSIEWRSLFEEIGFAVLDSSGVGSSWRVFPLGLHIFPPFVFIRFQESPLTHGFLGVLF